MITYIIQMDSPEAFVKFGRTKNPKSRLATLSTGTPWPVRVVCLFGTDCEKELKTRFADQSVKGEWFSPTIELKEFIEAAASAGRLVRQVPVDQAYINSVIKPRIREYLNGREPENNAAGDLVCRIFADTLPTLQGRESSLVTATMGHVSDSLARGFGPTNEWGELKLPASTAAARSA